MATRKGQPAPGKRAEVTAFLAKSKHPHQKAIEQLRTMILGLDARISEEIKWNAPSFFIEEHFATFRLHPPKHVQLVLHTGARARSNARAFEVDDPHGLLTWPAKDRAVLTLGSEAELKKHRAAVRRVLEQWLHQL